MRRIKMRIDSHIQAKVIMTIRAPSGRELSIIQLASQLCPIELLEEKYTVVGSYNIREFMRKETKI